MNLFYNGIIHTIDEQCPRVEAVLCEAGIIKAVGSAEALRAKAGADVVEIDLKGRALLPGFNDAHIHMSRLGMLLTRQVDLRGVKSIQVLQDYLRLRAETLEPGQWIFARGYDHHVFADTRHPTRDDLDAVSREHPILITHRNGRIRTANTPALRAANLDDLRRDGILRGVGRFPGVHRFPPLTEQDYAATIQAATDHLLSLGITSITDPLLLPQQLSAYRMLERNKALRLRVTGYPVLRLEHQYQRFPLPERFVSDWLRIDGVKFFADGGLTTRTAAVLHPYDSGQVGILHFDTGEMVELMWSAHQAGFRIASHASGDVAIHQVLMAYEALQRRDRDSGLRHRIEHMDIPDSGLLARACALNSIIVSQPVFIPTISMTVRDRIATDYEARCYPFRSIIDAGLTLAFSTDSPFVADENPLLGIKSAVDRLDSHGVPLAPQEAITIDEAVCAYTLMGAVASGNDDRCGSITPGKWADFVVLNGDPLATSPEELPTIKIDATYVNGQLVYERPAS